METIAAESLQQEINELEDWLLLNPTAPVDDRIQVRIFIIRKRILLND